MKQTNINERSRPVAPLPAGLVAEVKGLMVDRAVPNQKRAPSTEPEKSTEHQEETHEPVNLAAQRKIAVLREEGYIQNKNGLHVVRRNNEGKTSLARIVSCLVDVPAKYHIMTVPDRLGEKPEAYGVILVAEFTSLQTGEVQTLEIHRSDMLSRQPRFLEQIQAAKPPHKRRLADFTDALETLALVADRENRYNATGLLQTEEGLIFLNPAGGALTAGGVNPDHRVKFGAKHKHILNRVRYGWQESTSAETQGEDYRTLLRLLDVAPGSTGYGDVLLGILGFTPFSQMCDTGGLHAIVHGTTGSYKSATSRLLLQGYSNTFGRQETSTFNLADGKTTVLSMLQIEYYLAGMIGIADDALKGQDVTEKEVTKFWQDMSLRGRLAVTRQGSDRSTWDRGDMGFAPSHYPRNSSIVTVEILANSEKHASELARYIVVSLDSANLVDVELLTELQRQECAHSMNQTVARYIQWLLPRMSDILARIPEKEEVYRAHKIHKRTPTSYAKAEIGIEALLEYGVSIGAHTALEATNTLDQCRTRLIEVALRQRALMGIDEENAQANDAVTIFYSILHEAMRAPAHKLYVSDSTYRPINEFSSGGSVHQIIGYRPQPPTFLSDEEIEHGINPIPDNYGWKFNENLCVYEPLGVEAGVLKWDGVKPALHMYVKDFKEVIYPALDKLAKAQHTPLPGLNDMVQKLKAAGKLISTNPTNLHGRNSRSARVYILDMTPTLDSTELDETTPSSTEPEGTIEDEFLDF